MAAARANGSQAATPVAIVKQSSKQQKVSRTKRHLRNKPHQKKERNRSENSSPDFSRKSRFDKNNTEVSLLTLAEKPKSALGEDLFPISN